MLKSNYIIIKMEMFKTTSEFIELNNEEIEKIKTTSLKKE